MRRLRASSMAWLAALLLVGCGHRRSAPPPPPPARPGSVAPTGGPDGFAPCAPCSGRPLQCNVSGPGGPTGARFARVTGGDGVGCWGFGDPGLFDRDPQQFWFRCDTQQLCVERPNECYPARLTPTGFWLDVPGKNHSIICGAPR